MWVQVGRHSPGAVASAAAEGKAAPSGPGPGKAGSPSPQLPSLHLLPVSQAAPRQ
jgi:hypothetical protein